MSNRILLTGSLGQIGSELLPLLQEQFGDKHVISVDIAYSQETDSKKNVDVTDYDALDRLVTTHHITHVYHLAAILSAAGEKNPNHAWNVNVTGLQNILDLAKKYHLHVFWPSSIAVFGPTTPKVNTPQDTVIAPTTMYGITKYTGELLAQYYHHTYQVDVRCVRFPGLISHKTAPDGGTTDYAVDIFHHALKNDTYTCYLEKDTTLPMMYMPDALQAIRQIMDAPPEKLSLRTGYNLQGMSFSPQILSEEINKYIPLTVQYQPDFRQKIADTWPDSLDDSPARTDWNWQPRYNLSTMVNDMLTHLRNK